MTPKTDKTEDDVLEKIREIAKAVSGDKYIYRGQPETYRHPSNKCIPYVSSSLYRAMKKQCPEISGAEWLNMNIVQGETLNAARRFADDDYNDAKILSHIQHYGGNTNLIDFTKDYLVALFFACNQNYGEKSNQESNQESGQDGEVILVKQSDLERNKIEIITPNHPSNRVTAQKSIFVQPRTGVVPTQIIKFIPISLDLKLAILEHLSIHHGISDDTIYNDLYGYVKNPKAHGNAIMEFYLGLNYSNKADSVKSEEEKNTARKDAINHYNKAIDLNPIYMGVYFNRGKVQADLGNYEDAIEDYNKALTEKTRDARVYNNRGIAKASLGDKKKGDEKKTYKKDAIEDFDTAIIINSNYRRAYYNRGITLEGLGKFSQAIFDLEIAKKLALKQNQQSIADDMQKDIKRITGKMSNF